LERVLDYILNDQIGIGEMNANMENTKVFKIGFYSHEISKRLIIMVEIFDNDEVY